MIIDQFSQTEIPETVQTDPILLMEAMTGIRFLGAGTIIFRDQIDTVEGLTTASLILFVAGIGRAAGLNLFVLSFLLTIMAIKILFVLEFVQNRNEGYEPHSAHKKNQL